MTGPNYASSQLVPRDDGKSLEFLQMAFSDARSEIAKRMEFRERLQEVYILGSISLLVGFVAAKAALRADFPLEILLISPLFALVISAQLKSHVESIENLAEFIRRGVNPLLMTLGAWSPYWDFYTRQNPKIEEGKTAQRIIAQLIGIHLPSFLSLAFYTFEVSQIGSKATAFQIVTFIIACAMFFAALRNTMKSYDKRKETLKNPVPAPKWWIDEFKNSESR